MLSDSRGGTANPIGNFNNSETSTNSAISPRIPRRDQSHSFLVEFPSCHALKTLSKFCRDSLCRMCVCALLATVARIRFSRAAHQLGLLYYSLAAPPLSVPCSTGVFCSIVRSGKLTRLPEGWSAQTGIRARLLPGHWTEVLGAKKQIFAQPRG